MRVRNKNEEKDEEVEGESHFFLPSKGDNKESVRMKRLERWFEDCGRV